MEAVGGLGGAAMSDLREAIERDGFVVIRGYLPAESCTRLGAAILAEYRRLVEAGWKFVGGGRWEGNLNFTSAGAGAALWEDMEARGLGELIASLASRPMVPVSFGGNLAMPGSHPQNFHTDSSHDQLAWVVNVALVPTGPGNGATALVPGTHQAEVGYHDFIRRRMDEGAIQHDLMPGDVLLRLSTAWHRGTRNSSAEPRPLGLVAFRPADEADAYLPDFGQPPTIRANRYYGRAAALRELAAVHLPRLYDRFRLYSSRRRDGGM